MKLTKITGNGTFLITDGEDSNTSTLYTGVLGGAVVNLFYDVEGMKIDVGGGVLTDKQQLEVIHGRGAALAVIVTGFVSSFEIACHTGL